MNNRLSKRVKWILMPIMRESGCLYFRLTCAGVRTSTILYAKVRGVQRNYWLNHLLNRTIATEVEVI
jgi:hypothetical protein